MLKSRIMSLFLLSSVFFLLVFPTFVLASKGTWVTPDFYYENDSLSTHRLSTVLTTEENVDCRKQISKILCLVSKENADKPELRTCLGGESAYLQKFELLYDALPDIHRRMFCSVKRIFIEKDFIATAYAGSFKGFGAVVGIRKSILDDGMDFSKWATWKEQLNFGGKNNDYSTNPNWPTYYISAPVKVDLFLYQLFIHEFAHLFDFANDVNQYEDCKYGDWDKTCHFKKEAWASLSWENSKLPFRSDDFRFRSGLCFYKCEKTFLDPMDSAQLYYHLFQSQFINTYAATNPWDDFADGFVFYMFQKSLNGKIILDTRQGVQFHLHEKVDLPQFAAKRKYISNFLHRGDLNYPK